MPIDSDKVSLMTDNNNILIVDDDQSILATLRLMLKSEGFDVTCANTPQEAVYFVKNQTIDIVLMDLNYSLDTTSGVEGLDLITDIRKLDDHLPIVVMTGWATIDIAVQTMQRGAGDFVQKPWENDRLLSILNNQLKLARSIASGQRLEEENKLLKQALDQPHTTQFVGNSVAIQQLLATCQQVAATNMNILITGENGTGKSLLARYIHQQAQTNTEAFVAVNMGSISESLFESEMFGHVKGAFTDAKTNRIGRFELANNGTLFMDEIGNIPLSQQAKLLRVIEEQQFEKVGSSKTQTTSVRIISATNADLNTMVADKSFRMDLLYRLNTMEIRIPPLRERLEDIPLLAKQFLTRFAHQYQKSDLALSTQALHQLQSYQWPGNIRELSHVLERAVLLAGQNRIESDHLMMPDSGQSGNSGALQQTDSNATNLGVQQEDRTLDEIEKQVISNRLNQFRGNAIQTAKSLGLSRSAFYRRLDKYNI